MFLKTDDLDHAIAVVKELAQGCNNLYAELSSRYADGRISYLDWAEAAEVQLRNLFADAAIARSVLSDRYWRIAEVAVVDRQAQIIISEIRVQVEYLTALADQLESYLRLRNRSGAIVMLDTNVLLHYQRVDKVPWTKVTNETQVRLVVPLLVLDELDDKRYLGSAEIKRKARSAIEPFDQLQPHFESRGYATLPDGSTLEYLLDDPNHRRQTNPDEELLERAEFLHRVTHRTVMLMTGDRGMRVRVTARGNGLAARLMPSEFSRDQEEAREA